ncbi:MAG: hypothetical protein KME30_32055 [Iphinoe sp. HA4291-MV1]|jgi:hypothetical protein|nr:hypothetical protein [Iphinoe sp. HA4291-MV1]
MEPVGLTATAIATLIITKAFGKAGEKLGDWTLDKNPPDILLSVSQQLLDWY